MQAKCRSLQTEQGWGHLCCVSEPLATRTGKATREKKGQERFRRWESSQLFWRVGGRGKLDREGDSRGPGKLGYKGSGGAGSCTQSAGLSVGWNRDWPFPLILDSG